MEVEVLMMVVVVVVVMIMVGWGWKTFFSTFSICLQITGDQYERLLGDVKY